MDYYNEIKSELLNNEINRRVKTYSLNRSDLNSYYNVGKMLYEAGKNYGEGIIKKYSEKLMIDINKKYNIRYLFDIRKLYLFSKVHPLDAQLTISHYRLLFSLKDDNEVTYYIGQSIKRNLSKRQLQEIIRSNEYGRLPESTKNKMISNQKQGIKDYVKDPILIKNNNYEIINEKVLQKLVLEDIESFMKELGNSFSFIGSEYPIRLGDRYNYLDLLLFNYVYNCFVVVELKVTELKKEHIGQIQVYMNYIDNNIKKFNHENTIGIIICKQDNDFIIKYCSDERIIAREYILVN